MSTLLVTRPKHDSTVSYLHYWAKPILDLALRRKIDVIDLDHSKANRKEVEGRIRKLKPELIFLNGHGNSHEICGHDDEAIVDGGNADALSGSITYALSCSAAEKLGSQIVAGGGKAFIGYTRDFFFVRDLTKATKPTTDTVAQQFLEPANTVVASLLKGHTVKESYEHSQSAYRRNITNLLSSASDPEAAQYIRFLLWNMRHEQYEGDGSATV